MQVGWICVKHGFANSAPRLCARHAAVTFEFDGVGRQVVDGAVAAGGEDHRVAGVALDLAGHQVADDDAARLAVDDDQVEHLAAREHAGPLPACTCRISDW